MSKITFLSVIMITALLSFNTQTVAQNYSPAELAELNAAGNQTRTASIQSLLQRLDQAKNSPLAISNFFNTEEVQRLSSYFRSQQRNPEADIIPTAGATETFAVAVGDFFFDPGGPGGSSTGGTPGNYPNCGCITLTTLTGVTDIQFNFFSVFAIFDWLRIYDGTDTSGTVLYDNATGGANEGDITLADMVASNGSAAFTSTTGSLTFEFNATTVVDYGGWEVEILSGGGGGGGPMDFYAQNIFPAPSPFPFGTTPIAGPYSLTPIGPGLTQQCFADDYDNTDTLYALDFLSNSLITVDDATGVSTVVGPLTNLIGGHTITGLSFDFTTSTMYALSTNGTLSQLYTVDLATGTLTLVGAGTGNPLGIWLEIDNDGNAFIADIGDDNLYSVDLASGTSTVVGPLGFDISFAQDVSVDHSTNTFYAALYEFVGTSGVYTIDTATGAATLVYDTTGVEHGMFSVEPFVPGPPITNDDCENAFSIACGETVSGDTSTDTDSGGNPAPDEWFSFVGDGTVQIVTLSTCNSAAYDTFLRVFDACNGTEIAANDDTPGCAGFTTELSFVSDGTSEYLIMVDGFGTASGTFDLSVTCAAPLPGDFCDDALTIACGETVAGSTVGMTLDNVADCGEAITAPGVWYTFTDTFGFATDYVVSLCDGGTAYDSKITVYTGPDCDNLTCVGDNDDSCGLQSEVAFTGDGSSTYYILVHGFGGATGAFSLNLECAPIPPDNDDIENAISLNDVGCPFTDENVAFPAATLEDGNPADCIIDGANGVWYKFAPEANSSITCTIATPAGASYVNFFFAPDLDADEDELTLVPQFDNQCVPSTSTTINTQAGNFYYVFVVNTGGGSDVVFDNCELLGTNDATIEGFAFYPNPAENTINLAADQNIDNVALYNVLGQQVITLNVGARNGQLNVASLAAGAYFMKVTVNGQVGTYKVIKR